MAGATLARKALNLTGGEGQATYVSVSPVFDPRRPSWADDLNAALRGDLAQAGYPQPNEVVEEERDPPPDPWRIVAPGVAVRASEYEARFSHLDLEALRRRLTPAALRAFVRHIGIIQGPEDVDVNLLVKDETR